MNHRTLIRRSLTQYWRTNVAVVLGVATAVTVLAGALLVGDSVRGSLRALVLDRLGRTDHVVSSSIFFRQQLAGDLASDPAFGESFEQVVPLIALDGLAIDQATARRVLNVKVYGVDERFWHFVRAGVQDLGARDVVVSPALARALDTPSGGTMLLRVPRPSDIPIDSMHGRKDDAGRTLRLTLREVLPADRGGEFSLQPDQGEVRAAFVPIRTIQQDLALEQTVNVLLVSQAPPRRGRALEALQGMVRRHATIEDLGLTVRALDRDRGLSLEGGGSLISDTQAAAAMTVAEERGFDRSPVFTYLANRLQSGDRSVPYSLVTATDLDAIAPGTPATTGGTASIVLNDWTARDLAVRVGDPLTIEYFVWEDPGVLVDRSTVFHVAAIVPLAGAAADPDLAPYYPGITDSDNLRDWDPPFPIDLRRIRPIDEAYWRDHRTTPKAFISLETGQSLWRSRYGALTAIRVRAGSGDTSQFAAQLRTALDPLATGFMVRDARADGLAASRGATDFGEYFTYFSFFLVVSAVLLAQLFFKLGVEQRGREVGLLRAVGFATQTVRRLFVIEAAILSIAGSALGVLGALGYAALMMFGLRTWWVDAVGTTALHLHVSPVSLATGALAGVAASIAAIWWTLRQLARVSERRLLAGDVASVPEARQHHRALQTTRHGRQGVFAGAAPAGMVIVGVVLVIAGSAGWLGAAPAFFGAGAALLAASLLALRSALRRPPRQPIAGHGWRALVRLGARHASHRPGRSVLSVAVMASATFVLISVGAFRKADSADATNPRSGTGGYAILVESMLPIAYDPHSREGREQLGLDADGDVSVTPFRVLPGDDASCLNLYEPRSPRILGVTPAFVASGRFAFQDSLAATDREHANPWTLLESAGEPSGSRAPGSDDVIPVIPVIADANSMTYVLHRALGEDIVVTHRGRTIRLRLVAALADSVFQGELLMSEQNFQRLFPGEAGYRTLLVDAPPARRDDVMATIEDRLSDFGAEATPVAERLAEFHKVENTYLSTFQALGGLGLLLGTIGLGAVLVRNAFERRREMALLGAIGYRTRDLVQVVMAENAFLLLSGLVAGTVSALVAIAPAWLERGGRAPVGAGQWLLLFAVLATGLLSSWLASRMTMRERLLKALRAE